MSPLLLYIPLGVILVYVFFLLGPGISIYLFVFSRKKAKELNEIRPADPRFASCLPRMREADAALEQFKSKTLSIRAKDGVTLTGEYFGGGSQALAICAHGYHASPRVNFSVLARDLLEQGYDVLLIRQRGHGSSGGKRSTLGLLESDDLCAWIQWAEENTSARDLVLCGVSMGSISIALAADRFPSQKIRAMVLESCYSSVRNQMIHDAAKWHLPGHILVPIVRICAKIGLGVELKTSSLVPLSRTRIPTLFFHGTADTSVPLSDGQSCYEACASQKELCLVPDAPHTVAYILGGEKTKARLVSFLQQYVPQNTGKKVI